MVNQKYTIITGKDRPDLFEISEEIVIATWPEFMLHDPIGNEYWYELYQKFPEFQFALVKSGTNDLVATGNSLPLAWDGNPDDLPDDGWDWALVQGFKDYRAGRTPRTQCALSIAIPQVHRGKGISTRMVQAMKSIGKTQGLSRMIAPIRPNLKSCYPLTPMEHYVQWKNDDDLPFDAWIRVHARLGARIVKVCPRSMHITGTITDWERWTEMRFPESGTYIVPEALVPIQIDHDANRGTYIEPNVWMCHLLR